MPGVVRRAGPFARAVSEGLVPPGEAAQGSGVEVDLVTKLAMADAERPAELRHVKKDWAPVFLEKIMEGSSVNDARLAAGIGQDTLYRRRKNDVDFRAAWQEAGTLGTELLEHEAERRAYHGVKKPVFYKGTECGTVQEYSDTLLIFLLKARKPGMYRDTVGENTQPTAVNITVVNVDAPKPPPLEVTIHPTPAPEPDSIPRGTVELSDPQPEGEECGYDERQP